jgi:plasmid stability protein
MVLTIRAPEDLRRALTVRAQAEGKTVSELAREILEASLAEQPIGARAGHLKGRLTATPEHDDSWRLQLRQRNWRS